MDFPTQMFFILVVCGLMFVGAEVFVPGGILGTLGGIALIVSAVLGFSAFGPVTGGYVAGAIVILVGVVMVLWIKIFPNTRAGRRMTLSPSLKEFRATGGGLDGLVGREGEAASDLRPAGFAHIDGRRIDVVTNGEMISKGARVRVQAVKSNRVIVEQVSV